MRKHPFLISFSGFDGSGKSTQVALVSKALESKGFSVKRALGFQYFLLKGLIRSGRKVRKDKSAGPVKRNTNPAFYLFPIVALVDMWVFHVLKVLPLRNTEYVVYDRGAIDQAIALAYYGFLPKFLLPLYLRLIPKMNMSVLLTVSPDEAEHRSHEFPLKYYKEQFSLYETVQKNVAVSLYDGHASVKKITAQILKDIQKRNHGN